MLANEKLTTIEETSDYILGKLIWSNEPDYPKEEIRWNCKERDTPSSLCFQIVYLITSQHPLDIDMITLSRNELYNSFCKHINSNISFEEFELALEELLEIEFIRLNNGKEFDSFFVHE